MEPRWVWPFELLEKLAEGGMGVVYRARYAGNDRIVAVKLLPAELATDTVLLARFERELDVLKQLRHPNIVRCFGGKCESEEQFYAMELIDGGTLADLLDRKGQLSWEFVIDYAVQMCEALNYAHEHGVIHRDVKPGNFLLTKSGQIKLSDFGLASIVTTNRLTASGRTVGTIQYMAPEQIRGKALTGRVDLYALGCVLFEMLTGRTPYSGENAAAIMQQHLTGPIPHVIAEVPECPLKLDQLIFELMSKNPDQRPATAAEVGWRLDEILQPGLRVAPVDPDLFSTRPRIAPIENLRPTLSNAEIAVPFRWKLFVVVPWGVVVLLMLICVSLWSSWKTTVTQLHRAESQWVTMFTRSDPASRVLAARALADFGPLQASTIQLVWGATQDPSPAIRIAALSAIQQHATEFQSRQGEIVQIERTDEDPNVRHHASQVLDAMKQVPAGYSVWRLLGWGFLLSLVAGFAVIGWNVWRRLKPIATS